MTTAACSAPFSLPWSGGSAPPTEYREALARWQAVGPKAYTIELTIGCFCPDEYRGPFLVKVEDDRIVDVRFAPGGPTGKVPDGAGSMTVDGLFRAIARSYADRNAGPVSATYDPETGMPTQVALDPIENAIDDEASYTLKLVGSA